MLKYHENHTVLSLFSSSKIDNTLMFTLFDFIKGRIYFSIVSTIDSCVLVLFGYIWRVINSIEITKQLKSIFMFTFPNEGRFIEFVNVL